MSWEVSSNLALLNVEDNQGQSVLHSAIREQVELKTLKLLLDHGANPNLADHEGYTPLHLATVRGSTTDIFPLLFEYYAGPLLPTQVASLQWNLFSKNRQRRRADSRGRVHGRLRAAVGFLPSQICSDGFLHVPCSRSEPHGKPGNPVAFRGGENWGGAPEGSRYPGLLTTSDGLRPVRKIRMFRWLEPIFV
ncbi:hypothetical protein BDW62DRAFT_181728 [Aspergillus aurantiobrunneus]